MDPDIALFRLNEEKDKEIDRLTQQVKDLKKASAQLQDRMNCIPDDISREMSLDDDVFMNSLVSSVTLERFDGGVVMVARLLRNRMVCCYLRLDKTDFDWSDLC